MESKWWKLPKTLVICSFLLGILYYPVFLGDIVINQKKTSSIYWCNVSHGFFSSLLSGGKRWFHGQMGVEEIDGKDDVPKILQWSTTRKTNMTNWKIHKVQ